MVDTLTKQSDIQNAEIQTFYDEALLRRAYPYEVHGNFAQNRPIPQASGGMRILFRRYEDLGLPTTPLSEGQTPEGRKLSKTDITAEAKQYGDYVHITDIVDLTSRDPVLTEAAELLGEQMGKTRDVLVRDSVVGGYARELNSNTTGYDGVDGGNDQLSQADFENAVDNLLAENARFLTEVIRPSDGYNTTPVRPTYVAIMHPDLRQALEGMSDFVPISEYPSSEPIMDAEWGAVKNVRILLSTLADDGSIDSEISLSGNSNYVIPVIGADAYGVSEITGGASANIVKSEGGTSDPLNQRITSGWKMIFAAEVLNPKFMTLIHNVTK